MIYGLVLEYFNMVLYRAYSYGEFLIMIGPVPLMIAVDWSIIIFASMETTDKFMSLEIPIGKWKTILSIFRRCLIDAFLILNVDLSADAVAIRMGFWTWRCTDDYGCPWYGVPLSNFFGWFSVGVTFSFFLRLAKEIFSLTVSKRIKIISQIISPFVVIPCSMVILTISFVGYAILRGLFSFIPGLNPSTGEWIVCILLIVLPSLTAIFISIRMFNISHPFTVMNVIPPMIPAIAHGYFFVMIFVYNIQKEVPMLVVIAVCNGTIGAILHSIPFWKDCWLRVVRRRIFTVQIQLTEESEPLLVSSTDELLTEDKSHENNIT